MLLSTSTSFCGQRISKKEAITVIKNAGFDAYDCYIGEVNWDNYLEEAKELRAFADDLGIVCNQAHAPFPSSTKDSERDENFFHVIVKSLEYASILGAKIIVVHPKNHLPFAAFHEEIFKMNLEFYKRLIPYCEKFGIKVAAENLYGENPITHSCWDAACSRANEFCKLLDVIDSEWIVGCLDVGHASLIGEDIYEYIKTMGNERLQALHIHDTDYVHDSHTLPFMGKIDFGKIAKALGEIDYKGDFTFEVINFFNCFPKSLYQSTVDLMHDVGRYLINEIKK